MLRLLRRVLGETEAGELPAGGGREEVAIGGADVGGGRDAGASAKDDLGGHELAVVLAEGAGERLVAGVAGVAAGGPLPHVAEDLLQAGERGGRGGVEVAGFEEVCRGGWDGAGVLRGVGALLSGADR